MDRRISLPSVFLIVLLAGAPSASADLLKEVTTTVTSSLPNLAETRAPSQPTVPSTSPVQIEAPAPPRVDPPPATVPPVDSSGAASPAPSQVDDRIAGSVKESTGAVAGIPEGVTQKSGAAAADLAQRSHGVAEGPPGATSTAPQAPRVAPREPALVRRWLTRVWPAIALGPFGELLTRLPARWEASNSSSVSGAATLLLSGVTPEMVATSSGSLSERSPAPDTSTSDPPGIALPGGGEVPFFVLFISAAALMALLVTAVRRELGSAARWWPH